MVYALHQELAVSLFWKNILYYVANFSDAECCLNSQNKFVKYSDENLKGDNKR